MAVRKYKPTTPGRRGASVSSFDEITRATPEKALVAKGRNKAGRNNKGRITTRHQGGGNKNRYRLVDFRRNKDGVPARVAHIEYDPNRSARIALLHYVDGEKRYILAPQGVEVGDMLMSGADAEIRPGNALPLRNIPVGTVIHAIELKPGAGAKMARSAGTSVQLMAKEGSSATLRLPSGFEQQVLTVNGGAEGGPTPIATRFELSRKPGDSPITQVRITPLPPSRTIVLDDLTFEARSPRPRAQPSAPAAKKTD